MARTATEISTLDQPITHTKPTAATPRRAKPAEDEPDNEDEQVEDAATEPAGADRKGFFEFVRDLTIAQWENHFAYVYRLAPITDRLAAGGATKYLTKYAAPFDEERMKIDHGSGTYRVMLNKVSPNGKSKTIRRIEFDIEDKNFPPNVPEGEWTEDARNQRWAWARKKNKERSSNGDAAGVTMEMVRDIVRELNPRIDPQNERTLTSHVLEAVKETRKEMAAASDPKQMIGMLKDLVTTFMPQHTAAPAGEGGAAAMMQQMMTMVTSQLSSVQKELAEERKFTRELILANNKKSEGGGDEGGGRGGRMGRILDTALATMLSERLTGTGKEEDWKSTGMRILGEQLPEAIGLAKTYFQSSGYRQQEQQPAAAVTRTAQPAASAAQPAAATATETTTTAMPDLTSFSPDQKVLREMFLQWGKTLVTKFRAGMPGANFADLIVLAVGEQEYTKVRSLGRVLPDGSEDPEKEKQPEISREQIIAVMRSIPAMWQDLTTHNGVAEALLPELNKFLSEFIDPPEDEPAPPPTPINEVKATRKKK